MRENKNSNGKLRNYKKQQRTVQAPGGFTDTLVAGNSPSSKGLGRGVAEL